MGIESARFHGIVKCQIALNVFCCLLCIFNYQTTPILKTLGQFENLLFGIMSTRENIRLIARRPLLCVGHRALSRFCSKQVCKTIFCLYTGGKPRNYHEIVLTQICSQATSGTRRGSFQAENWIKKGWCHVHFCFILQLRTNNGEIRQCSSV